MPTDTRQTGLIAKVVNEHLNDWEDFAGLDINIPAVYQPVDVSAGDWDPTHWSYRGQASVCQLANGNIVRVRLGDWTNAAERRIERQIITDPTDPSQWQTWAWLAYGDNYAVAIEADAAAGAGYRIYHAKSDGLYMDNVQILTGGVTGSIVRIKPVYNKTNMIYYCYVSQGGDGNREMNWSYIPNTLSIVTGYDIANWHNYHHDMVAAVVSVQAYRFRALPINNSERELAASDTLLCETVLAGAFDGSFGWGTYDDYNAYFPVSAPDVVRHLKGPSQRGGFKRIDDLFVTRISDADRSNVWYLFYVERNMDAFGNTLSNLKAPLMWSRSTDAPYYMSQAVPTGFSIWGFAGVVVSGGYVYACGNGRVLRRPLDPTRVDVTDYVLEGRYEVLRDNAKGSGTLTLANPQNVLGAQLGMTSDDEVSATDHRLEFGLGNKRDLDLGFTFKRDSSWWISALRKTHSDDKDQIEIDFEDFWHRLENPFRDTWAIPGKFTWADWQPDAQNQLNVYSNQNNEWTSYNPAGADASSVPRLRTVSDGTGPNGGTATLFAGWRGEHAAISARVWSPDCGFVFRYIDENNYYMVECNATGTYVSKCSDGVIAVIMSSTADAAKITGLGETVQVLFAYWSIQVWVTTVDGAISTGVISGTFSDDQAMSGFVGLYAPTLIEVSNFTIDEPHAAINTAEVIKYLLSYIRESDVAFEEDEETLASPQSDLMFGPQSDLDTPEKAMRQLLEASALNIVWRQDDV